MRCFLLARRGGHQLFAGVCQSRHKAPTLQEFSSQFLRCVESATLAKKTTKYYRNGWRLLSDTNLVSMRLDRVTKDDVDVLTFRGSAAPSVNCALRTLRRMLHKAEEWNLLIKVPRFNAAGTRPQIEAGR